MRKRKEVDQILGDKCTIANIDLDVSGTRKEK